MNHLLTLFVTALSLTLPAQQPMFTTDVRVVDGERFVLANKGTKSVTEINKTGAIVKEWAFDKPVTGLCINKGIVYATNSYGKGWLTSIDLKMVREKLEKYPDKATLSYDLYFMYDIRKLLPLVGNGPCNLLLSEGKLIIPTYFSDTLNIIDVATLAISTVAYNPGRKETPENIGEKDFNDASYCYQNWQSSNGCHPGDA